MTASAPARRVERRVDVGRVASSLGIAAVACVVTAVMVGLVLDRIDVTGQVSLVPMLAAVVAGLAAIAAGGRALAAPTHDVCGSCGTSSTRVREQHRLAAAGEAGAASAVMTRDPRRIRALWSTGTAGAGDGAPADRRRVRRPMARRDDLLLTVERCRCGAVANVHLVRTRPAGTGVTLASVHGVPWTAIPRA